MCVCVGQLFTPDLGAYPASCPLPATTVVQKIVMIWLTSHMNMSLTISSSYTARLKSNFYFSITVHKEAPAQGQQMVNSKS